MGVTVALVIDGDRSIWAHERTTPIVVRENQLVSLEVTLSGSDTVKSLYVFVEDYELVLHGGLSFGGDQLTFSSEPERLFRESFGGSVIRVVVGDVELCLLFDVLAKKIHAAQAEKMIMYLAQRSEEIIRLCFSRTLRQVGVQDHGVADPEMVLSSVEAFLSSLQTFRVELAHQLRTRLVPRKVPSWRAQCNAGGVDPADILSNLDAIVPVPTDGDVFVRGRQYSISGMDVTALEEMSDVEENAVLLGGLYSMRRVVQGLLEDLSLDFSTGGLQAHDKEYVSLGDVVLRLTAGGMIQRGERALSSIDGLIRYFERTLKIVYRGELRPTISPFVRASRLYRTLYQQLQGWYELGTPSLGGRGLVVKLRSLSKIYEYFVLFKLVEYMDGQGWILNKFEPDTSLGALVPSMLQFSRKDFSATLQYEPKIYPLKRSTQHLALVDLKHSLSSERYWWPDFVLKIETSNNACFVILDAKYSTHGTVRSHHLPLLFEKYFVDMAVYDANKNVLDHGRILGVLAIYPAILDESTSLPALRWRRHGLGEGNTIRLPIVTGLPLSPAGDEKLVVALNQVIDIVSKQLS